MSSDAKVIKKNSLKFLGILELDEHLYNNQNDYFFKCPVCDCKMSPARRTTAKGITYYFTAASKISHAKDCEKYNRGKSTVHFTEGYCISNLDICSPEKEELENEVNKIEYGGSEREARLSDTNNHQTPVIRKLKTVNEVIRCIKKCQSLNFPLKAFRGKKNEDRYETNLKELLISESLYNQDKIKDISGMKIIIDPVKIKAKNIKDIGISCDNATIIVKVRATRQSYNSVKPIYIGLKFDNYKAASIFLDEFQRYDKSNKSLFILTYLEKENTNHKNVDYDYYVSYCKKSNYVFINRSDFEGFEGYDFLVIS